jgi:hypothetical protein
MAGDLESAEFAASKQLGPSWRNMSLTLLLVGSSNCAMSNLLPCVELQKLKQQYQTALRIWGQFEFPIHNEQVGPPTRQAERLQLKERALKARNEASERLLAHREHCRICKVESKRVQ